MSEDTTEKPKNNQEVRNFELGIDGEIKGKQKGRVIFLDHPEFGSTWLIDITDQKDPSVDDYIIGDLMKDEITDPYFQDAYSYNNGLVAAITARIDPTGRQRVYLGVRMTTPTDRRSSTMNILKEAGLQFIEFYVPLSFDNDSAKELMYQELKAAITETGDQNLIKQLEAARTQFLPESAEVP